ncbi:AAA family ATPase [Arthrobacter sp. NEB 688]|uniref:AAA family ATPase n=1 Tax=Arthrobacter sp. NEB 688 TaxID=904039 RepID=UPI001566B8AC|nr:AAA family ATPase [Arthrobacter sp. NEB 688]QKE85139.1 AAA family ATPase [Arthrobacter sp. NEB 688]
MSEVPIQRLVVSDFRRIEGTRELPFDAPIVLIHGPNGTGKTSVLSALELGLTGAIRSMERQSDRYRAHLPFFGQAYATVRADVADYLQVGTPGVPLTVNGARLEGTPSLSEVAAKFYAERCYLDQSSLGRLLDLYQTREGNEQTALEQFVNEILGLEKLDALRDGLSDANDLRLFKRLAVGVDEADREAKAAAIQLEEQSALRVEIRKEVARARTATRAAITGLHADTTDRMADGALLALVRSALNPEGNQADSAAAMKFHQELIALGGRISALAARPSMQRMQEARTAMAAAITERKAWEATDGAKVRAWEAAAEAAGLDLRGEPRFAVEQATNQALQILKDDSDVGERAKAVSAQLDADRVELDRLQAQLATAHEHSSALVETMATLRTVVDGTNVCPVCDRDFSEVGPRSLVAHIDSKLAELTDHRERLVELRSARDQAAAAVARAEAEHAQLTARRLPSDQLKAVEMRYVHLSELSEQSGGIDSAKAHGASLNRRLREVQQELDTLETAASEERHISHELARYAALLQVHVPSTVDSFQTAWRELLDRAGSEVARLSHAADQRRNANEEAGRLEAALKRESEIVQRVADIAENKKYWDDHLAEAKRRQGVAREVHKAATQARARIVHQVFTESLNDVWKSVFTRLAPNEGFIPRFGVPSATKKTFNIMLETTHRNGDASGPPQMMLSAGNLNTAALSLFLALHLAVEPIVPCLVFDDPVQAMDEVHVAQFAGLIRLLAKRNSRQVIIAVHDRELFDYLALELSPAYAGDELITIELGERAADEDQGVTRHVWEPDHAIAN